MVLTVGFSVIAMDVIVMVLLHLKKKKFVKTHEIDFLEMDLDNCIEGEVIIHQEICKKIGFTSRKTVDHDVSTVEGLAQVLHEAGREVVLRNAVVKKEKPPIFKEWDEIDEAAREGRRIQARYLLTYFIVSYKRRYEYTLNPQVLEPSDEFNPDDYDDIPPDMKAKT